MTVTTPSNSTSETTHKHVSHDFNVIFAHGDLLWPELDLELCCSTGLNSCNTFTTHFQVLWLRFRSRTAAHEVSKPTLLKRSILTFDLTLTWLVTLKLKFYKSMRCASSRAFVCRPARLATAIGSGVLGWGCFTLPPPPPPASRWWWSTPADAGLTQSSQADQHGEHQNVLSVYEATNAG